MYLEQMLSGLELLDTSELLEALPSGLQFSGQEPSGLKTSCLQLIFFLLGPVLQLLQLHLQQQVLLGKELQECSLDCYVPHFLCLHDFVMTKICHVGFSFSGFNLLGPSYCCPFCTDTCLLPGLQNIFLAGAVWELEDEVSELHAFERHSLYLMT